MRNIWLVIIVVLIVAVLSLYGVSFQVRETEAVIVTRFEKPRKAVTEPGLYWKWPPPIETVHRFDSRQRVYEGILEETNTQGGEPLTIISFAVWQVGDPMKLFSQKTDPEMLLADLLREKQNAVVGQHYFDEFINSDPAKIRFEEIEGKMTASLAEAMKSYGVEVRAVGIKALKVSEETTQKAFDATRADRYRKAENIRKQGEAIAERIRTDAESKRIELLAAAEGRAKQIRGEGDAEAARYYRMLEEEPEFAMFLRNIDALKTILSNRTTIVLGTDVEPIDLLRQMPKLQPKNDDTQSESSGSATESVEGSGLHGKLPPRIETGQWFDSRQRVYEGMLEETNTKGGEPLTIASYAVWRVGDPMKLFSQKTDPEMLLADLLREKQNAVVGQHYFDEFINSDPSKIQFEEIEGKMTALLAEAMETYGIEVRAVGIKQLKVSEETTQKAFDAMRADRYRRAENIRKQSEAIAVQTWNDDKQSESN